MYPGIFDLVRETKKEYDTLSKEFPTQSAWMTAVTTDKEAGGAPPPAQRVRVVTDLEAHATFPDFPGKSYHRAVQQWYHSPITYPLESQRFLFFPVLVYSYRDKEYLWTPRYTLQQDDDTKESKSTTMSFISPEINTTSPSSKRLCVLEQPPPQHHAHVTPEMPNKSVLRLGDSTNEIKTNPLWSSLNVPPFGDEDNKSCPEAEEEGEIIPIHSPNRLPLEKQLPDTNEVYTDRYNDASTLPPDTGGTTSTTLQDNATPLVHSSLYSRSKDDDSDDDEEDNSTRPTETYHVEESYKSAEDLLVNLMATTMQHKVHTDDDDTMKNAEDLERMLENPPPPSYVFLTSTIPQPKKENPMIKAIIPDRDMEPTPPHPIKQEDLEEPNMSALVLPYRRHDSHLQSLEKGWVPDEVLQDHGTLQHAKYHGKYYPLLLISIWDAPPIVSRAFLQQIAQWTWVCSTCLV
jgi:hypothetical protein